MKLNLAQQEHKYNLQVIQKQEFEIKKHILNLSELRASSYKEISLLQLRVQQQKAENKQLVLKLQEMIEEQMNDTIKEHDAP